MESMSFFTFRKKMLTKKIRFFGFSTFFIIRYHTCNGVLSDLAGRVHKKNAKKREKTADLGSHFGEMERNGLLLLVSITMVRFFFIFNAS
jgi:hypothetical protein